MPPASRSGCAGRGPNTWSGSREAIGPWHRGDGVDSALHALSVLPVARSARHAPARRRPVLRSWATDGRQGKPSAETRAESIEDLLAAKEIVIACGPGGVGKTTTAAAAAAMAAVPARRQSARGHRGPGPATGEALGLEGIGQRSSSVPSNGPCQAAGARAPWRAVGGHARHQAELGRPGSPSRPGSRDGAADPGQPALPEHLRQFRPEP